MTQSADVSRTPIEIIDEIERTRARNNANWMDILRALWEENPEKAKSLIKNIFQEDLAVSALVKELLEC